jgi:hypothetical protein
LEGWVAPRNLSIRRADDAFADPPNVRHQGPWQGMHRGEIEKLKPEYRLALARDGYTLVKSDRAVFKPEV